MTTHWSEHMVKRKGQTRNIKKIELKKKLTVTSPPAPWAKLRLPGWAKPELPKKQ